MQDTDEVMRGYARRPFEGPLRGGGDATFDVYERGEGPPVVLMQELPGIGLETLRLADTLVGAGFRVVLPHLLGPLGRVSFAGNTARVMCMRREFRLFARRESSPIVEWLRALCRDLRGRHGVAGVGVIGMCLTGSFALTLIADESVLAAVASQPGLPVLAGASLHMSEAEQRATRAALRERGPMLALRFARDPLCPAARFASIDRAFNRGEQPGVELVTLPGRGHSVLTIHFDDTPGHPTGAALDRVLAYLERRLRPAAT